MKQIQYHAQAVQQYEQISRSLKEKHTKGFADSFYCFKDNFLMTRPFWLVDVMTSSDEESIGGESQLALERKLIFAGRLLIAFPQLKQLNKFLHFVIISLSSTLIIILWVNNRTNRWEWPSINIQDFPFHLLPSNSWKRKQQQIVNHKNRKVMLSYAHFVIHGQARSLVATEIISISHPSKRTRARLPIG